MSEALKLDTRSSAPLYQRIKQAIEKRIDTGQWAAGTAVPSENQLVADTGASRMTVNRALRELAQQGKLRRVHGVGTFVAEAPRHAQLIKLKSIAEEIREQGKTHHAEVLVLKQIEADELLATGFSVPTATPLFYVELIHFQDNVPIQLEKRAVNPSLVPDFLAQDFSQTTPAEYLIEQLRADEMEHVVQAITIDLKTSRRLQIPVNEPCLKLKRRTWKGEKVVTAVEMIYPSSRYDLRARYNPADIQIP